MLSRRRFLKHTGIVALSALGPGLACAAVTECLRSTSVKAFVAEEGAAAVEFSRALPFLSCGRTDITQGLNFHDAILEVAKHETELLVGLTRDSEYILMRQIAEENGYELIYHGSHHDQENGLVHTLSGSCGLIDRFVSRLSDENVHWAALLANSLPEIAKSTALGRREDVFCRQSQLEQTPNFLVSWAFRYPATRFPS